LRGNKNDWGIRGMGLVFQRPKKRKGEGGTEIGKPGSRALTDQDKNTSLRVR